MGVGGFRRAGAWDDDFSSYSCTVDTFSKVNSVDHFVIDDDFNDYLSIMM